MAWHWATRSGVSLAAMASLVVDEPGFQVTLEGQLAVKSGPEAVMHAPPAVSTLTTAGCWQVRAHISGVCPHLNAFQLRQVTNHPVVSALTSDIDIDSSMACSCQAVLQTECHHPDDLSFALLQITYGCLQAMFKQHGHAYWEPLNSQSTTG